MIIAETKLPRGIVVLLALFPIFYALLSLAMGQDANWDLKNYHWYNGYAFLNGRHGFDLLPSQTPYFYNPLLDGAFYAMASSVPAWVASFVLSALQGMNFILLFFLARQVIAPKPYRDPAALLIATLGMLGGGWLAELGTTFYDNLLSLGIFGSALLALKAHDKTGWRLWILAGIPVGLATGIKLPSAIFCVGLCGACFFLTNTFRQRFTSAFLFGLGVLAGMAITLGFWSWHLWVEYGNPLFPYFNNIFHSPITLPTSARDTQFVVEGWAKLTLPFDWTLDPKKVGEVPFRDLKLPLLYILLPLALLIGLIKRPAYRQTTPQAGYILAALAISYICWLFIFSIYRYAVPLEALAALGLFIALDHLPFKIKARQLAFTLIGLLCLATIQIADWGRISFKDKFVQADMPPIDDPVNTMVLMAGFQPYSHVIPSLPVGMPVIRIQSNFASPGEPKQINQILKDRVTNWPGKFLLLLPVYDVEWISREVLPQFGLKTILSDCQIIEPNFSEPISLCPVDRL